MLAVLPTFNQTVQYEAAHTGSKLLVNGRTLDSFDVQFYDKWGSPLTGIQSFIMELTVDFVEMDETNGLFMNEVKHMLTS